MKHLLNYLTVAAFLLPLYGFGFNTSLTANQDSIRPLANEAPKVNANAGIPNAGYQIRTVVIDPGHGGKDPGCSGVSSREKHLVLAISLKVAKLMRARYPDIKVIMTRDKDVFIPLYRRAAIANRAKADLFISIHCNYMPKLDWVRGSETYVMGLHTAEHNLKVAKRENAAILLETDFEKNYDYDPNSPEGHIMLSMVQNAFLDQSILFAEMVEGQIHSHAGRRSRGVKQAGFVVLKETMMPSVLVEAGFLSNGSEENYLKTAYGQSAIAQAIVNAFGEYKAETEIAPQALALYSPEAPKKEVQQPIGVPETPPSEPVVENAVQEDPWEDAYSFYQDDENRTPYGQFNPSNQPTNQPQEPLATPTTRSSMQPEPIFVNDTRPTTLTNTTSSFGTFREDLPIHYRVQLAASKNPLPEGNHNFNKVEKPVEVIMEDGFFKYQILQIRSRQEGNQLVTSLRKSGFTGAFLLAYQEGKRVKLPKDFLPK